MNIQRQIPSGVVVDIEEKVVREPARATRVAAEADVIVAGGSLTGVCAALGAARNGAKVVLVEQYGFLGGQMTAGLVCSPHRPLPCSRGEGGEEPIFVEILRRCVNTAGLKHTWVEIEKDPTIDVFLNPEVAKYVLIEMLEEAGVELLLHSFVSDAIVVDGVVRGIIVENKAGRSALLGGVVVDATGDADVAARAGAPYILRPVNERWGPGMMSLMCGVDLAKTYKYLEEHPDEYTGKAPLEELEQCVAGDYQRKSRAFFGFPALISEAVANGDFEERDCVGFYWMGRGIALLSGYPGPHLPQTDCLNARQVTDAESIFRKWQWRKASFFRKYVPGFEDSSLIATGVHFGVRETRTLWAEHVLNGEDVKASREFDDTVFSVPQAGGAAVVHVVPDHPNQEAPPAHGCDPEVVGDLNVPYRTLLPREVDNLLVAGRCVGYMIGAGALFGQAAGTAAALSVKNGVPPRNLDVPTLQETLRRQGFAYAAIVP